MKLLADFRGRLQVELLRSRLAELPAPRHRASDPRRMEAAEQFVEQGFVSAGWTAERQSFPGGVNIVATLEASDPAALVVVAHLDTVAGSGGADDNGSGVVALLELARLLAAVPLKRTIVLAAVDLEEAGSFAGSEALIGRLTAERPVAGAIVLESIAFTDARPGTQRIPPGLGLLYPGQLARARAMKMAATWTLVVYRASALVLARALADGLAAAATPDAPLLVRDPLDLPFIGRLLPWLVPTVRHFARSDHVAFWRHGIPAILVTDTADMRNPRYHTGMDLPDSLDYQRLADTILATALAVTRLARGVSPG